MRVLVDDIARGRIPEGEWLPKEVDLAERFEVSRGVARETIRALEERGVVAVRHGRGAQVRPVAEWDLLDAEILDALVASGRADDVVGEALECRRLLEGQAAASAALRIQPDGARVLTEAFARLRAAAAAPDGDGELARSVSAFRGALVRLSGNRPLGRMLAPLDAVDAAALSGLSRPARRRLVERYEQILSAVCAGDGDAAREAVEDDVAATAAELAPRRRGRAAR